MASTAFVSTIINSIPSRTLSNLTSQSSSSVFPTPTLVQTNKDNAKRLLLTLCKATNETSQPFSVLTKRDLSISLLTSFAFILVPINGVSSSNAAILEADDDEELMEKVKQDRKKRLERQGILSSFNKETGYLQEVVYKLSKVGQAIENNDLSSASSVIGNNIDSDWVKKANLAFSKISSSPEEKTKVDTFNSSLSSLISSVAKNDIGSSKTAFVASASAFEEWSSLTGLFTKLKGL